MVDGPAVPQIPLAPKVNSQSISLPAQTPGASQLTPVENFETNLFSDEPCIPGTIGRVECSQLMLTTSSGCTLHASVDCWYEQAVNSFYFLIKLLCMYHRILWQKNLLLSLVCQVVRY